MSKVKMIWFCRKCKWQIDIKQPACNVCGNDLTKALIRMEDK